MNPEFQPLADAIYHEHVLRVRKMTPEERMLEGVGMLEAEQEAVWTACSKTIPSASDTELNEAVRRHFRLARQQERGPDFYEKLRYLPVP
jgi:hypothetical protein